ncbi:UNVERIFIED_CONTAM: FAD synthase [Sesamum radiatum]|uniref:FAD synthase n=1 Tax=Sesamum radiatum TaxID=300843 RepID=A0AAW2R466_SESRA
MDLYLFVFTFSRVHRCKSKMEIDEAIKESGDKRLKSKYNSAIYVIQRALALYSVEEVALSFNGGKDSTVLLHLLRASYYLHVAGKNLSIENPQDAEITFPIRTIYFESPTAFPEINSFTYKTAFTYKLQMDIIRLDFKSGLEALLKANPIRAIFLGVRSGDPTGVGQEQFSPSSPGWPPFMRVNPILDWSYRDVWAFLLTCKVQYCSLYDQGSGTTKDRMRSILCRKIHSIGWAVSHVAVVRNDVFIFGGFGPLPSDITVAGVAKAFGGRMAPSEELQEHLRRHIGEKCTGDTNEIKCQNVIILTATNVGELEQEWDCLIELMRSNELSVMTEAFVSKRVATSLSDAEAAQPLSEILVEFPDLIIGKYNGLLHLTSTASVLLCCHPISFVHEGGYRESRRGPLIFTFKGKDKERIRAAAEALCKKFHPGTLSEID